jgi:hypothetical protein
LYIWNHTGGLNYGAPPAPPTDAVEKQTFNVVAPQFNLDPKLINTFYPPLGHEDEARILPHIVFNDPHVPWFRKAGVYYDWLAEPVDSNRNMVPWLAVIVFDAEDLAVSPADAAATGLTAVASYNPAKLPEDGAFPMSIGDYLTKIPERRTYYQAGYKEAASQNDWNDLTMSTDVTSVIFPTKGLLQQIFGRQSDSTDFQTHLQNQKVRYNHYVPQIRAHVLCSISLMFVILKRPDSLMLAWMRMDTIPSLSLPGRDSCFHVQIRSWKIRSPCPK